MFLQDLRQRLLEILRPSSSGYEQWRSARERLLDEIVQLGWQHPRAIRLQTIVDSCDADVQKLREAAGQSAVPEKAWAELLSKLRKQLKLLAQEMLEPGEGDGDKAWRELREKLTNEVRGVFVESESWGVWWGFACFVFSFSLFFPLVICVDETSIPVFLMLPGI